MYHVIHPGTATEGVPPENFFIVQDEMNNQVGTGRVIYQFTPHADPDVPINMYFDMKCALPGRYVLLGALLARARQLRDANPQARARVYTIVHPEDTESQQFYTSSGLSLQHRESVVTLHVPEAEGRVPMGCQIVSIPVNTPEEKLAFLSRLAANDIRNIDFVLLQQFMRTSHFQLLGILRENQLACELMMVGNGDSVELMSIYTHAQYRRQGLARTLLHRSMTILSMEGVKYFQARIMTRSRPQMELVRAFGAEETEAISVFPEMEL